MGPVQSHFHLNVSLGLGICHLVLGGETAPVTMRELYSLRQLQETRYRHMEEFWKLQTVLLGSRHSSETMAENLLSAWGERYGPGWRNGSERVRDLPGTQLPAWQGRAGWKGLRGLLTAQSAQDPSSRPSRPGGNKCAP